MAESKMYSPIIADIFFEKYSEGDTEILFAREEIEEAANRRGIKIPKNLGDVVYSFKYRKDLPKKIRDTAGQDEMWCIRQAGRGKYRFSLVKDNPIAPTEKMAITKVPDSTPGIVAKYSFGDEQALLAKLRYNRLVDIFTGVTCYSLQNHLRTTVSGMGQVETDEIYVGVDKRGAQYVFPVQAKGGRDKQHVVQIEQDFAVCEEKFPELICRAIGAQFMGDDIVVLFEFEREEGEVKIVSEKHYKLVPPDEVTQEDLGIYRNRLAD